MHQTICSNKSDKFDLDDDDEPLDSNVQIFDLDDELLDLNGKFTKISNKN